MANQYTNPWTTEEIKILTDNYNTGFNLLNEKHKLIPNRSKHAIESKASELKIHQKQKWSENEKNALRNIYGNYPKEEILSRIPNRTWGAIQAMAAILNLSRFPPLPDSFTEEQYQLVIGSLLGDATVFLQKEAKNARFTVAHRQEDQEFLFWKHDILRIFCTEKPIYSFKNKKNGNIALKLQTRQSPLFTKLRNVFYEDNKKVCPESKLYELNALGLAIWIMDDGFCDRGSINSYRIGISTDGFTYEENSIMQEYFLKIHDITPTISPHEKHYRLLFPSSDSRELTKIIKPYIVPCMIRKIGENKKCH